MKAAICRGWGPPSILQVEEVSPPPLPPTQVRIKVSAAGVGFQDVLMIAGKYETKPDFPLFFERDFISLISLGSALRLDSTDSCGGLLGLTCDSPMPTG